MQAHGADEHVAAGAEECGELDLRQQQVVRAQERRVEGNEGGGPEAHAREYTSVPRRYTIPTRARLRAAWISRAAAKLPTPKMRYTAARNAG